ncbi:MAG: hypothetical protein K2Q18_13880, partial [Bdellovibrionales bacterium]|nr:hypothetical protein [Bdellovibrionales bacterium]
MRRVILLGQFVSLLTFNAFAQSTVSITTFEKYKTNFQVLQLDLVKLAEANTKNPNPLYTQMLKDMTYLKEQYDHIATPLYLDDLYQDAKDNKWLNLQKMSKALIPLCENTANYNIALCKNGFEEMRTFALSSKLSAENKESLTSFIDDYLLQIQATHTMNADFIASFNKNAEAVSTLSLSAPKIIIKKAQTPPIKTPVAAFNERTLISPNTLMLIVSDVENRMALYAA